MHRTRAPPRKATVHRARTQFNYIQTTENKMSKVSRSSVIAFCAVLAACAESATNTMVTEPAARPSLNESLADVRGAVTADGPSDFVLGLGNASMQRASAAPQAATGGRASGHVYLTLGTGFFTAVASEEYSFNALSTSNSPTPLAAKGQYDLTIITATGAVQEIHGSVICMTVTGNTARMAGQITSVVVNGIPRAINPASSGNIWNVTDNGEGNGTADTASPMIFFPVTVVPLHCANDFIPPQFANEKGNVQVKP
jgi:hypothetical protein